MKREVSINFKVVRGVGSQNIPSSFLILIDENDFDSYDEFKVILAHELAHVFYSSEILADAVALASTNLKSYLKARIKSYFKTSRILGILALIGFAIILPIQLLLAAYYKLKKDFLREFKAKLEELEKQKQTKIQLQLK